MNPHHLSSYLETAKAYFASLSASLNDIWHYGEGEPAGIHTTKKGLDFSLDCIPKQYRKQVEKIAKQPLRNPNPLQMTYSHHEKYGEIVEFQNKIFSVETRCQVGFRIRRTGIIVGFRITREGHGSRGSGAASGGYKNNKGSIFGMFD